jgi:hypothetical protein
MPATAIIAKPDNINSSFRFFVKNVFDVLFGLLAVFSGKIESDPELVIF